MWPIFEFTEPISRLSKMEIQIPFASCIVSLNWLSFCANWVERNWGGLCSKWIVGCSPETLFLGNEWSFVDPFLAVHNSDSFFRLQHLWKANAFYMVAIFKLSDTDGTHMHTHTPSDTRTLIHLHSNSHHQNDKYWLAQAHTHTHAHGTSHSNCGKPTYLSKYDGHFLCFTESAFDPWTLHNSQIHFNSRLGCGVL